MTPSNGVEISPDATQALPDAVMETLHQSKTEKIADILRGAKAPMPQETEAPAEPAKPLDFKTVAEKLGIDPAKLYDVKVPIADGEELSFGEWKDGYKAVKALEAERKTYREEKAKHEADKLQTQRELDALLKALPQQAITQELIQMAQDQLKDQTTRQTEGLLRAVPDWVDSKIAVADAAVIKEFIKGYGFDPGEFDNPSVDFRLKHLLRDVALKDKELKAVKAKNPPAKASQAPSGRPATPAQEFGRIKAAVSSKRMSRTEAVSRILKGA